MPSPTIAMPNQIARMYQEERNQDERLDQVDDHHRMFAVPAVYEHSCHRAKKEPWQGLHNEHDAGSQG